jgi:hypothetical protein
MSLINTKQPPITQAQLHYIECLAIDLCFDRHTRNAHISSIIDREIKYLDELTKSEASKVIEQFKASRIVQQSRAST